MIEVKNLSHQIGQSPILKNINLTIPNGGITALVGANGAGKSTLLSLIARLNPIQRGQILLDSYDIATTHSRTIAQNLADKATSAVNLNGKSGKFSPVASG